MTRDLVERWELVEDGPAQHGFGAIVWPVRTKAGLPAALKIGWPHEEAEHEHLALRAYDGDGAVRLHTADPHHFALLLERADSSRDLNSVPVLEACEIIATLYGRLHRPALPQLRLLSDQAAGWAARLRKLHDHPAVPRRLIDQAAALAADFATDPATDGFIVHTDLHYFNVLAAEREPWLVIDPKPLSGDPCFEIAPLLWNRVEEAAATGNIRHALLERLFTVVDTAGLDEDRVRNWVIVRELVNVMWTLEEDHAPDNWLTNAIVIAKAVQR